MRRELTVQEGVLSPGVKTVLGGDDSGVSRAERDESVSWSGPGSGDQMLEVTRSSGQGWMLGGGGGGEARAGDWL